VLADAAAGYGDGEGGTGMHKTLGVRDLTAFGIAAIVGAGIFSTIGSASHDGGPRHYSPFHFRSYCLCLLSLLLCPSLPAWFL
jgi:amino acid permease